MAEISLPNYSGINFVFKDKSLGEVITSLLPYVLTIAGLLMLGNIIYGGFTLMTAGGDPAASKKGYGSIQFGIIGFLLVFVSFFVVQLVEVLLGVSILN